MCGLSCTHHRKKICSKNFYIFCAPWKQCKSKFLYFYVGFVFCNKCISFLHAISIQISITCPRQDHNYCGCMKITLYLCHLGPIGKLPVERERSWVSTLSEAGSQNLVYFIKIATFFTRDALGNWCPSENIRKINELVQNRADNIDYFLPLLFWADWLTLNIFCWMKTLLSLIFDRGRVTKIGIFYQNCYLFHLGYLWIVLHQEYLLIQYKD